MHILQSIIEIGVTAKERKKGIIIPCPGCGRLGHFEYRRKASRGDLPFKEPEGWAYINNVWACSSCSAS